MNQDSNNRPDEDPAGYDPRQANNPLHGKTLEAIVIALEDAYGWDGLAERINLRCFQNDPSVKSSLKFLRRTPWAREKVEKLYLSTVRRQNPWG